MVPSVLIVDDDSDFLELAARVFDGLGIEVVAMAPDAAAAVIAAEATRPAAALVDVGLPDRNGIDLAYELAALPWAPRVVLTSTDKDAARAIEARNGLGKLPFIPKEELANKTLRELFTIA
jgi:CheY-like chemotaxis protein